MQMLVIIFLCHCLLLFHVLNKAFCSLRALLLKIIFFLYSLHGNPLLQNTQKMYVENYSLFEFLSHFLLIIFHLRIYVGTDFILNIVNLHPPLGMVSGDMIAKLYFFG